MEWDGDKTLASTSSAEINQEINIQMPNISINIKPSGQSVRYDLRGGASTSTPIRGAARTHTGMSAEDLGDWIGDVDPGYGGPPPEPYATRAGRFVKPPVRFDHAQEEI